LPLADPHIQLPQQHYQTTLQPTSGSSVFEYQAQIHQHVQDRMRSPPLVHPQPSSYLQIPMVPPQSIEVLHQQQAPTQPSTMIHPQHQSTIQIYQRLQSRLQSPTPIHSLQDQQLQIIAPLPLSIPSPYPGLSTVMPITMSREEFSAIDPQGSLMYPASSTPRGSWQTAPPYLYDNYQNTGGIQLIEGQGSNTQGREEMNMQVVPSSTSSCGGQWHSRDRSGREKFPGDYYTIPHSLSF